MKISFDFDSTLTRKSVQKVAKELIARGDEVHIVTSRFEDTSRYADPRWSNDNRDLFRIAKHLGIKRENIHFMNMQDKSIFFLENSDFVVHLDDYEYEYEHLNTETEVSCVLCDNGQEWQKLFREITNLKEKENEND
jgi:hypothetical protein